MYDELELDMLGDRKTALVPHHVGYGQHLQLSDFDGLHPAFQSALCDKADDVYGGKLPIHVRCLIDECANIGQIPNLEKLVATIRSREISACLVLQARSQLKGHLQRQCRYHRGQHGQPDFLGGSEPTTLKELSETLGKGNH